VISTDPYQNGQYSAERDASLRGGGADERIEHEWQVVTVNSGIGRQLVVWRSRYQAVGATRRPFS
jgi:hypothetical protein